MHLTLPGPPRVDLEISGSSVLNEQEVPQGFILMFRDITRLRQLENTRSEFVANVSHELRTPLSMIKGFAETLLESASSDPAQTTRFLQVVKKHADRLTFLIEDLLTLSQLESGRIVMNMQRFELRELVDRVLEDLQTLAAAKKVIFENRLPEELWVKADEDRIEQVFLNLVDNAIKYGSTGGHVTIGMTPGQEHQLQVWVRDDGIGIPAEAKERVFERFYRVDQARSREKGGTGLGLAIVKHIVQAHGGAVWVESELGQCATFFFTLPRG
jgi:two-component system, OmpR family, phosphate regulon sensor histidine kinase PhoR